jgi:predicted metal-binding protein
MSSGKITIFVCVACKATDDPDDRPGARLIDALRARLIDNTDATVEAVECLAVCKRPATLAFAAPGKWTYVVGDLDGLAHVDDVIAAAFSYAASDNGIVPWKERPQCFRKGVVSRLPPLPQAAIPTA